MGICCNFVTVTKDRRRQETEAPFLDIDDRAMAVVTFVNCCIVSSIIFVYSNSDNPVNGRLFLVFCLSYDLPLSRTKCCLFGLFSMERLNNDVVCLPQFSPVKSLTIEIGGQEQQKSNGKKPPNEYLLYILFITLRWHDLPRFRPKNQSENQNNRTSVMNSERGRTRRFSKKILFPSNRVSRIQKIRIRNIMDTTHQKSTKHIPFQDWRLDDQ